MDSAPQSGSKIQDDEWYMLIEDGYEFLLFTKEQGLNFIDARLKAYVPKMKEKYTITGQILKLESAIAWTPTVRFILGCEIKEQIFTGVVDDAEPE